MFFSISKISFKLLGVDVVTLVDQVSWNLEVLLILFSQSLGNLAEAERTKAKHGVLVGFALIDLSSTPQTTTSQPVKTLGDMTRSSKHV